MNLSREMNVNEQSLQLIERFAKCVSEDKNQSDVGILKELLPLVSHFSNALEFSDARKKVYNMFVAKIDSSTKLDCETILMEFNDEINEISKQLTDSSESEKYESLMRLISAQDLNPDDNEEIVAVSQNINNIDPITKLPIVEPVKNKICGHVYEKSSIMQLLKRKGKTKCPIAGCIAADQVQVEDLISDYTLKRILSEKACANSQKKIKVNE